MVLVLIMIGRGWDVNHYRFIQSAEERSIKPQTKRAFVHAIEKKPL